MSSVRSGDGSLRGLKGGGDGVVLWPDPAAGEAHATASRAGKARRGTSGFFLCQRKKCAKTGRYLYVDGKLVRRRGLWTSGRGRAIRIPRQFIRRRVAPFSRSRWARLRRRRKPAGVSDFPAEPASGNLARVTKEFPSEEFSRQRKKYQKS